VELDRDDPGAGVEERARERAGPGAEVDDEVAGAQR
jgi:hypothetical protein